jgi:tetratricopeptide (TPR) repeat protein
MADDDALAGARPERSSSDQRAALSLSAAVAFQNGNLEDAAHILRRLVALDPAEQDAAAQLALTLARLGRLAEVHPVLEKSGPWGERPDMLLLSARAAIACGAFDRAQQSLDLLEKANPNDPRIYLCRAQFHARRGQRRETLDALIRAADRSGDDPNIVMELGSAAYQVGDTAALENAVGRARQICERTTGNQALAQWLIAALIRLHHIDEAEERLFASSEAHPDFVIAENSRIDRLVAQGQYESAANTAAKAADRPTLQRQTAPFLRRHGVMSLERVVVHNGHPLTRAADADDIAASCGCSVFLADLHRTPIEHYASPGALIVFSSGIDAAQWTRVDEIRRVAPSSPIVAWLFDSHHCYLWNRLLARAADISFPSHATPIDYLRDPNHSGLVGRVIPLAVTQWSRPELTSLYRDTADERRSDQLHGMFGFHKVAHRRNVFIDLLAAARYENTLGFIEVDRYLGLPARERFLAWRRHKTSLCIPVNGDLSTRFFDALAAGQIPIVPMDIPDFDRVIPPTVQRALPVIRLRDYSIEAAEEAHAAALAAFDARGEEGALRRHRFVLERHMLAHRIGEIVESASAMLGHEFRRRTAEPDPQTNSGLTLG